MTIGAAILLALWGYTNFLTVPAEAKKALESESFQTVIRDASSELNALKKARQEVEAQQLKFRQRVAVLEASFGKLRTIHAGGTQPFMFSTPACISAMTALCRRDFDGDSIAVPQDVNGNTLDVKFACIR